MSTIRGVDARVTTHREEFGKTMMRKREDTIDSLFQIVFQWFVSQWFVPK
jgi:hypothetical protein